MEKNGPPETDLQNGHEDPILEPENPSEWEEEAVFDESSLNSAPHPDDLAGQLEAERQRYIRLAADFSNFRKRVERQREQLILYATEGLLKDLLPVADDLERAVTTTQNHTQEDGGQIREGVELIAKRLMAVLERHGVQPFDSVGEPFDPTRHEAVLPRSDESQAPNVILDEMERGFLHHHRLLRAAKVVVNQARRSSSRPPLSFAPIERTPVPEVRPPTAPGRKTEPEAKPSAPETTPSEPESTEAAPPAPEAAPPKPEVPEADFEPEAVDGLPDFDEIDLDAEIERMVADKEQPPEGEENVLMLDESDVGTLEDWEASFGDEEKD